MTDPLGILFGFATTQIVYVAVRLGVPELLADGARSGEELAEATGAHAPSLRRLLRGLASHGIVSEPEPDRYALTLGGQLLRTEVTRSAILLFGAEQMWRAWGELEYSVRTGKPSFDKLTGASSFEYFAAHPEQSELFQRAMSSHTAEVAPEIVAGYEFASLATLVDVGGGDGTLLAAILHAVPTLQGVLYDAAAGLAAAPARLRAAGVADRCEVVAGDFFATVPPGGDGYLLKSVIHDWDDARATRILENCRLAGGTVLVVEPVLPPGPVTASPEQAYLALSDLNMLVNTGGRERTEAEFRALYAAAGLDLVAVHEAGDYRILEGTPAPR
ncbi:MAG: methyltransferase [Micromonosporaceae bacterium]